MCHISQMTKWTGLQQETVCEKDQIEKRKSGAHHHNMTESFRNIEDESFPSFLSNSLGSNSSGVLGNVTLCSNLGLPVAASTIAKIRPESDNRVPDIQASYLEDGQFSLPLMESMNAQKGKFALSFKDDLEDADDFIAAHRISDILVKVQQEESTADNIPSKRYGNPDDDDEDDIDVDKLLDDGLESYFRQVGPPGMQRGHIEGQELPEAESKLQLSRDGAALQNQQRHGPARENMPVQSSTDQENDRFQFVDHYEEDNFQIPNVRLAATGMDSCPASDEDTEDELEAVHQQNVLRQRCLLPSTTRQLVGESNNTRFRPGLEGGSSDEETCVGVRNASNNSGIAFRRSAEGQVINSPLAGGGGDGTSESDEDNGGLATIPTFSSNVQTTYGDLRGLGIVGCNVADKDDCDQLPLQRVGRNSSPAHREDAMDNPEVASASGAEDNLDSLYFRNVGENCKPADQSNTGILQRTQNSFHLSQFVPQYGGKDMDGPRGGPCGYSTAPEVLTDSNEEGEEHTNADSQPSLDNKYLSPTPKNEDAGDRWNHHLEQKPDWNVMFDNNGEGITAPQGEDDSHKVIYQNEEGDWVTDLAYYSSFNKEANLLGDATNLFQDEDFISGTNIIEKIAEDEEEFEKEHCFIQEEKIDAQNISLGLGDTSWKLPTSNYVLMRASQAPSDYDRSDQSYLRLSLGQFFGQRSEALGFLGDFEYDIRRVGAFYRIQSCIIVLPYAPSFGYLITSPEKREPFALIRPSDFSYSNQDQDDTLQFGDEDKTLNPDDLEEQLEENDQLPSATFNIADPELHTAVSVEKGKEFQPDSSSNSSYVTNKTNLPLSISTIASAIADASVSADPAQLAAMIMELSAKNRSKRLAAGVCENSSPLNQEQSEILETLHKTCPAGEVNMFDMEKYLKKTESVGYDSEVETRSVSPYSFDSPDWADSASIPQRHAEPNPPECSERKTLKEENTANKKQNSTKAKVPEQDVQYPEDTQFSFRPSTSPLTHSSPSQVSGMETVKGSSSNSPTSSASSVERHICGSLSPQSDCSSLSLSRLTYVSVYDGTLQNSTIIRSPEKPKNNDTIQLSTTIVRASPTPPVDQDLASGKADAAPSSASPKPKRSNRHQSAESMGARSKSEHNNRTKLTSEIGKQQSEPCLTNQERENYTSSNSSNAMDQPENVNQTWKNGAGETPSLNMFFANRGAGMFTPDDCRYVPISSFKPHGVSNVPCVAPALPTLLTGHSLFTSPIAQQYLGNLPTLHPYGMGAHSGPYGVPVGLPRANLSPGHVQNTVPLGVSAPHQVAGFLNAAQFYNAHSSAIDQNLNAGKPYQTHEIEVGGLGGWNGGGIGSGHVVVPEELKFPNACCVGIASQNSLGMFNPTDRWMQVNIAIHSLSINGEKVESLPHQWLIVKNKTIIGPKTTEEQKVLFIPPHPGVYQCVLSVSSWPVSADTEVVAQAEAFAGKVLMMAMAETPSIENATAWRCFTFCKNPVDISAESALQVGRISPLAAPSHISHVMHANYGEEPEEFLVWIHFRAPQKYMSSGDLGPADEYSARINIEVDSPGPSHVITSILLHARSGIARIHAPKHLQTVHLSTLLGTTAKQMLPLKNAGNIDVQLKIKITNSEDCFSVKPEDLFLRAGDEQEIMISFTSQGNRAFRERQQKLVLRNNSLASVQQLRLLIRGQDQDCFQLQSTFGPEERLSSHRELTVRPNEDAAVHLLFTPTRVSCMLAKLEIKQSGMRSTQPGIKFTIPLSGYGGTSNIILEDVKKLSDSYIVTLNGIAPGKVSKVTICMRNTGSRAAYIKAIPFMDLQTEKLMDPKVISISPQQFVLKERTRKVITVLCKSTQRENELCATKMSCLSTICFFCGDEISRQQFRRLLSRKPEAGKQMLPKNSLLKNVIFNERFFEEEQVSEVYDLPQRPNDDQLFYRNMNKVILLVFGNSEMDTSGSDYVDSLQLSPRHSSESDSGLRNPDRHVSNASLDVLPVKGPQGPPLTLSVSDKVLNKSLEPQQTWSIQPEQLILSAPSIVQILADIAPEVSATASSTKQLSVLPAQPETPILQMAKPFPKPPSTNVEIKNKTLIFPTTTSGASSESHLEVENNGEGEVRWYLSSFAPPYVKGVDDSGDVYRATYTAFRCSRVSGTLEAHGKIKVAIRFLPRGGGDYAQFWDLECHPITDAHMKHKIRFQLCGTGRKAGGVVDIKDSSSTLVRIEAAAKARKIPGSDASAVKASQDEGTQRGVFAPQDSYTFPYTRVGGSSTLKVNVRNNTFATHMLKFVSPKEPFHIKHSKYSLRTQHYINLPVQFRPDAAGKFEALLLIQTDAYGSLTIQLAGEAVE
ncbi:Centrosomal protein of 192 kDa [Acipenser ruthenus]|uniref:Centrosomal protein of 192 kDa n=1 Tax=Acipenser ruthenus TaxID=7906 RepID=A0A444U011_ACIRT|nr:Centrosomal protein of 192 kDa [Acipenser ruthenus]